MDDWEWNGEKKNMNVADVENLANRDGFSYSVGDRSKKSNPVVKDQKHIE